MTDVAGTYRWWPVHTPLPDGWEIVKDQVLGIHHVYSVLIKKIEVQDEGPRNHSP